MTDKLILLLTDIFFKLEKEGKDGFLIIGLSVPCKILAELYDRLCQVDVPKIENITQDEKEYYWNLSHKYCATIGKEIATAKSAYILKLITNS